MDTLLQGIPNTLCYLDDILITDKTDAEHLSSIEEVLKWLQENGLRVKLSVNSCSHPLSI